MRGGVRPAAVGRERRNRQYADLGRACGRVSDIRCRAMRRVLCASLSSYVVSYVLPTGRGGYTVMCTCSNENYKQTLCESPRATVRGGV
eukprot:4657798-Prymnesium_polylepis.1